MLRRRAYGAVSVFLFLCALAGLALIVLFSGVIGALTAPDGDVVGYGCALGGAALCLFFSPDVILHEGGHILAGLCAGMRFPVVRIGRMEISRSGVRLCSAADAAGETGIVPHGGGNMRARLFVTTLGGALFPLLYGAVVLALLCTLPLSPVLLFFALLVPFSLCNGLTALLPAELAAGRTDGGVLLGILRMDADTDASIRVLTAQGILYRGSYADIPRALLDDAPVVREDSRAFKALLFLRYEYCKFHGDADGAERAYQRLCSLDSLTEEERGFLQKEKNPVQKTEFPDV